MMDDELAIRGVGNYSVRVCTLRSAISDYEAVVHENGTMSIDTKNARFKNWTNNTRAHSPADSGSSGIELVRSTYSGLIRTASATYASRSSFQCVSKGSIAYSLLDEFGETLVTADPGTHEKNIFQLFRDPLNDTVAGLNELHSRCEQSPRVRAFKAHKSRTERQANHRRPPHRSCS